MKPFRSGKAGQFRWSWNNKALEVVDRLAVEPGNEVLHRHLFKVKRDSMLTRHPQDKRKFAQFRVLGMQKQVSDLFVVAHGYWLVRKAGYAEFEVRVFKKRRSIVGQAIQDMLETRDNFRPFHLLVYNTQRLEPGERSMLEI